MSKTLGCGMFLRSSLGNSPECPTTSAELQDSRHRVSPKRWSPKSLVHPAPEPAGPEGRSQKQSSRKGGYAGQKMETRLQRPIILEALPLCNCCKFRLPSPTSLPPKPLLPHQALHAILLPLPPFQPFCSLTPHRLPA